MLPEASEAIKIADEHLAGHSIERRKGQLCTLLSMIGDVTAAIA